MSAGANTHTLPNPAEAVAAIGGQMLCDAEIRQKSRAGAHDFFRRLTAIKLAKQHGNSFNHRGIGIRPKLAAPLFKSRHEPNCRQASLDTIGIHAECRLQRRRGTPPSDDISQSVLRGLETAQFGGQLLLLLGNGHFTGTYCGSAPSSNESSRPAICTVIRCGLASVQAATLCSLPSLANANTKSFVSNPPRRSCKL